jgi:hypothetical protein
MKRLLYMLYGVVLQHKMCGVVAKFFSKRGVLGEIVLCRWSLIFSAYAIWKRQHLLQVLLEKYGLDEILVSMQELLHIQIRC